MLYYSILQAVLELFPIAELTGAFVLSISAKVEDARTLCISSLLFLIFVLRAVKSHTFRIAQALWAPHPDATENRGSIGSCVLKNLILIFPGLRTVELLEVSVRASL